jgi:hypothetical protein
VINQKTDLAAIKEMVRQKKSTSLKEGDEIKKAY